tara:strand:+ start:505 stop:819 length:315 start_codon:yes stop_codon:yes gene_type:complete
MENIEITKTDEEGNKTHYVSLVEKDFRGKGKVIKLKLMELVGAKNSYDSSDIQIQGNNYYDESKIDIRVTQWIEHGDTDFNINANIVITRDQALKLISDLARHL